MTAGEVLTLIAQGEGQRVEFKRSLAELERGVRTVAAFANTEGGDLLFGVRDRGGIIQGRLGELALTPEEVSISR